MDKKWKYPFIECNIWTKFSYSMNDISFDRSLKFLSDNIVYTYIDQITIRLLWHKKYLKILLLLLD